MIRRNGVPRDAATAFGSPHGYEHAACKDSPDLFFGPAGELIAARDTREKAAKGICAACPARALCLADSMKAETGLPVTWRSGIYGGLTEAEREAADPVKIRRHRPAAAVPGTPHRTWTLADFSDAEIRRFWGKTQPGPCGGPRWTAGTNASGYGRFTFSGDRRVSAVRLAYMLHTGRDPGRDDVLQECGDRLCLTGTCLLTRPCNQRTPHGLKAAS